PTPCVSTPRRTALSSALARAFAGEAPSPCHLATPPRFPSRGPPGRPPLRLSSPSPLMGEGWGGGEATDELSARWPPPPRPSPTRGEGEERSGRRHGAAGGDRAVECVRVGLFRRSAVAGAIGQALLHRLLEGLALGVEEILSLGTQQLAALGEVIGLLPLHAGIHLKAGMAEGVTEM